MTKQTCTGCDSAPDYGGLNDAGICGLCELYQEAKKLGLYDDDPPLTPQGECAECGCLIDGIVYPTEQCFDCWYRGIKEDENN